MKKKVISLLIALSMACSLCACGSSGKDTTKTDETVQENAAEESPEADGVEDVPDKATDETPDEASDEINEYGLTDVRAYRVGKRICHDGISGEIRYRRVGFRGASVRCE